MPLVSVVVPTHNRPTMLAEALASVRAQTFTDYEIIVVSNGETPRHAAESQKAAALAGALWVDLEEGNRSLARNIAIKQARGEWIAFLDDDDLWNADKLERQIAFARKTGADCIFTDFVLYDVNTGAARDHHVVPVIKSVCSRLTIPESFMVWRAGTGGCSTALVRRQALLELGAFDTNMTLVEDWDMWRRISQKYEISYLEEILAILRTHSATNGENHAVLRPWKCTYWEVYHIAKAIRTCPPELRHMIPQMLRYIFKRAIFWHAVFVIAGIPGLRWLARKGRPLYRRIAGREVDALREWLRPRRRINALFGREIFHP